MKMSVKLFPMFVLSLVVWGQEKPVKCEVVKIMVASDCIGCKRPEPFVVFTCDAKKKCDAEKKRLEKKQQRDAKIYHGVLAWFEWRVQKAHD